MSGRLKGDKKRLRTKRGYSFFKPMLEVLEDRRLLNAGAILQGTVVDDSNHDAPLANATVQLWQQQTNSSFAYTGQSVTTGSNGSYSFTVAPGTYQLRETTLPSNYRTDATQINASPVETASQIDLATIQVTVPATATVSVDGSQFQYPQGTNNPSPPTAPIEPLAFKINGVQEPTSFVGQDYASINSTTFNTFCVDLSQFLTTNANKYTVQPQTDLTGIGGANVQTGNAGEIAYLYNLYNQQKSTNTLPSTYGGESVDAAAAQVAIWSLEYNASPLYFDSTTQTIPTGNHFYLTAPNTSVISQTTFNDVVKQATAYLNAVAGQNGQAFFLDALTNLNTVNGGIQGILAPNGSFNFSNIPLASPTINTIAGGTVVVGSGTNLTDSAALSGGSNPTGTITFYLFAPGVTPNATDSNNVYSDTVTVSGNGTYTTAAGTNPGGYLPTTAGTYQWLAVYSGDSNNNGVAGAFGDEPETVSPASPAISTTPNSTNVALSSKGFTLKDSATISGSYNGTGSITFTLYYNGGATPVDTETVSVSGDGTYSTPTGYTLPSTGTVTGTYQWDATYSGDSNNNQAIDKNNPNEQVTVSPVPPASGVFFTTPNTTSVTLGTSSVTLTDSATLGGDFNPTGTITFTLVAPNGSTVDTETVTVSGNGTYSTPTGYALPITGSVTGTYQWNATYSGDGNNPSVSENGSPFEQVLVSPATPSITTQGSETANGVVGTAVLSDTATLSGGYNVAAGSPAPTITFSLIAPNGSTVYTETQTVTGDTSYTTTGTGTGSDVATQVGTYYWNVSYNANGNTNNNSVTHSGQNDTNEQLTTTPATPALTTQGSETANGVVGSAALSDTATLSGGYQVAAGTPAPTLTFTLIAPNGSTVYTETQTVTGDTSYTTTGTGTGSDVATQVGTYYWNVSYSGNTFNNSVTHSGQNDTNEQLTTVQATPAITTQGSETANGVVGSAVLSDSATLSGGYNVAAGSPAPTITFSLIAPNGSTVYTETQTVTGDTSYTTTGTGTGSDVATQVGTYYWNVSYSGNTFNTSVTHSGANDTNEQLTTVQATPALTTQGSETANGVVGTAVLSDTATLSGGYNVAAGSPAPTITFSLIAPNGSTVYTETQTVTGDTSYTTTGTGTGSDVATQVGTYYWNVSYSGNTFNTSVTHSGQNDTNEQLTTIQATPSLTTQGSETANGVIGSAALSDTATLSGGYQVAAGTPAPTLTFTLIAPNGSTVYTETQTVTGDTSYTTTGTGTGSDVATQVGTYYWNVSYSGNIFNNSVTHSGQNDTNEQLTVIPASPAITTTPYVITTTGTGGQYATIGFWHNKNGQAVITNFDSGPSSTLLGNSLATNFPHLFGAPNPYTSAGLASFGASSFAGLTNAQVAAVYLDLWTPSGSQKNTYVQAFAVALGGYASGGAGTFNVGSNGAAFGVANNSTLPISQILQIVDSNFSPTTGLFYSGDATLTSDANNVLDGINSSGETPGGSSTVSVVKLNDSASLTGGDHEGGTITFYLFAPGVTPNATDSNNVYSDTVTVNGDGTYNTTLGTNPGGYLPTATGTYQWVAVYSGDTNNSSVTSPFGSEPWTVGQGSPTVTTVPGGSVVLGSGNKLTDTATLADASNPGGSITFYLFAPGVTPNANDSNAVYSDTVTVTGNGNYSTATGTNPGGYLPTTTGTYQWVAIYSGDANNAAATSSFGDEPETVSSAGPSITTTPGGSVALDSNSALTDSATLSGGFNPGGTITFYLFAPGVTPNATNSNAVYSDTVTVNGNGTYTTSAGSNPGGFVPAVTGTFQWVAVYSGDSNNSSAVSSFGSEPETVTSSGPVSAGDFATIGFWHNKNGQAVINSFNGSSTATGLGNWLATNFPNLFGTSNPYISATLTQYNATSLAGLTNAQVAQVYLNLWNPSGVTKNTYVQAFAVALGVYADSASLGYNSTAASFGFKSVSGGGGNLTFSIGSNGAAFGVANNTSLTVMTILQDVNAAFGAALGTFFNGDQTKTSELNNVLNGINTKGDNS